LSTVLVLSRGGAVDTVHCTSPVEGGGRGHRPLSSPCRGKGRGQRHCTSPVEGGAVDTGHCTSRVEGAAGGHTPPTQLGPATANSTVGLLNCVNRAGRFHSSCGQVRNWGVSPVRPDSTDDRLICVREGDSTDPWVKCGIGACPCANGCFHRWWSELRRSWVLPQMVV